MNNFQTTAKIKERKVTRTLDIPVRDHTSLGWSLVSKMLTRDHKLKVAAPTFSWFWAAIVATPKVGTILGNSLDRGHTATVAELVNQASLERSIYEMFIIITWLTWVFIHLKKEHFSSPERMQLRNVFPWSGPEASTVWAAGCRPQKQTKPSSCLTDASFSPGWLRGLLVSKGSCLYSARVNLGSSRLKLLWLTLDSSKLVLWLNKKAISKLFILLLLNSSREMDLLPWPGKMLVVSWS